MKLAPNIIATALAVICIHHGGLIVTAVLDHIWMMFLGFEYLPWARLLVVAGEIYLAIKLLRHFSEKPPVKQSTLKSLFLWTILAVTASQFASIIEPEFLLCGFAVMDGTYDRAVQAHEFNTRIVELVEAGVLVGVIAFWAFHHTHR